MNMEGERHGPFKMKDQSDGFMEPLPGRLPFDEVVSMDEAALDARLAGHLKGASVFKDPPPRMNDVRRLEVKRIYLALLEGYQTGGAEFADWYGRLQGDPNEEFTVQNSINKLVSRYGSDALRERRAYTREELLFEAEMISPRPETAEALERIHTLLTGKGLQTMSLREMLIPMPMQTGELEVKPAAVQWSLDDLLRIFYLTARGELDDPEIARMLGKGDVTAMQQARSRHFTVKAKNAMRLARGFDRLPRKFETD